MGRYRNHKQFPIDNQGVIPLQQKGCRMEVFQYRILRHTNLENLLRAAQTNFVVEPGVVF